MNAKIKQLIIDLVGNSSSLTQVHLRSLLEDAIEKATPLIYEDLPVIGHTMREMRAEIAKLKEACTEAEKRGYQAGLQRAIDELSDVKLVRHVGVFLLLKKLRAELAPAAPKTPTACSEAKTAPEAHNNAQPTTCPVCGGPSHPFDCR